MFPTAIIIFREILEIAMIVGSVLVATRCVPGRMIWIIGGFVAGCAGAGLVAVFAGTISASLSGMGQEFFNAVILFTAAGFIGWTALWVRRNAHTMTAELRRAGRDVVEGNAPLYSLTLIIGLALLREGSEIVLFIYGIALSGQSASSIIEGSIVGFALGLVVGTMLYFGLLKIPTRHMLTVTSWLLFLLVAGLASQGVGYLSAAGYFETMSGQMWDTSWILSEDNIVGKSLHTLIGYTARPTLVQLITYFGTLGTFVAFSKRIDYIKKKASVVAPAVAIFFTLSFVATPALALDEIYSPAAEPGELSLEYNGSRTFDSHAEKNDAQDHEAALEYGINDFWTAEMSAGFAKDPGDHLRMEDAEIENRFQFFQPGEMWIDSGLLVAYDFAMQGDTADSAEVKLLLQKDFGMITGVANIGFTNDVGRFAASGGPDYVFLANTRYRINQYFQPGVEIQSDFGQSRTLGHFQQQEQYIGPAAYGTLFGRLKYQAAYLLGATDASAQSSFRILLEYEMHF
jgi:FTR1 family protein